MLEHFAATPEPPYFAVIFTSKLHPDHDGYGDMGDRMFELALQHPGCLGLETARNDTDLVGITVCYWKDEASIAEWKADAEHQIAQKMGIEKWYEHYELRVANVNRAYSGPRVKSTRTAPR